MSEAFDPVRTNNLDLLRLFLAILVVLGHSRLLLGDGHPPWPFNGAAMAVEMFFTVSGFLIASSYDRAPLLRPYLIRRAFRIYPLYVFVVIFIQFLGMLVVLPGGVAGHGAEICRYLGFNLVFATFMAHDIGGLLAHSPVPGINPSLWTLKIEVGFYVVFPALWWLVRRYGSWALLGMFVFASAYNGYFLARGNPDMAKQLFGSLRFFVVGMTLYRYRRWIKPHPRLAGLLVVPLYFVALSPLLRTQISTLYPLVVGAFVYVAGFGLPRLALRRDYSYGIYLIHGPLIQLGIVTSLYRGDFMTTIALYIVVFATAALAEICIEVPAIELGRRLSRRVRTHELSHSPS